MNVGVCYNAVCTAQGETEKETLAKVFHSALLRQKQRTLAEAVYN